MKVISKTEAKIKIDEFFQKKEFTSEQARKIKKLAMSQRIKLSNYRQRFCKKCYSDLKIANTKITKTHKLMTCKKCGFVSKIRIIK